MVEALRVVAGPPNLPIVPGNPHRKTKGDQDDRQETERCAYHKPEWL